MAGLTSPAIGAMAPGEVHLDIRGVGKSFGGTRALHEVSVEIRAGSVHAFVGENGAGKSTLGKIVAGVFPQDQGELHLRGEPVSFGSPREALERGIALVAQEVAVVPQRTVAENVFLGAEPRRFGFVRRRELLDRYRRVVAGAGFEVPANATVGALPLAVQQQVEILRALARDAELIVFDEPTAALSATEIQRFHEIVRGLSAGGRTVILVSHFLGEVLELADTVTILRDGQVVRTGPAADRDGGHARRGHARPVGRPDLPAQAGAGRGRADRAVRPGPHGARRARRLARDPGRGDRGAGRAGRRRAVRSWPEPSSARCPSAPRRSGQDRPRSPAGRWPRSRRRSR